MFSPDGTLISASAAPHCGADCAKLGLWIQARQRNRKQHEVINGKTKCVSVTSSVPQGLQLGPTLLPVFINDTKCDMLIKVLKLADDTKICGDIISAEGKLYDLKNV